MTYTTKDIRNAAILGHGSSGKTTLVERILFETKTTSRFGRVAEGSSLLDVAPDERERGSSIDMHLTHASYHGAELNLIDTPGAADFVGDAILPLAAVDGAIVAVDSKDGVKVTTRKAWARCAGLGLPRFLVVTRLDMPLHDFDTALRSIQASFGDRCLPLFLPDGNGVESVLDGKSDRAKSARTRLVEAAVEIDERLLVSYLEGVPLTSDEIRKVVVQSVIAGKLFPVIPTSAETGQGVQALLDSLVSYFPSPLGRPARTKKDGKVTAEIAADGPFSGYVFKTVIAEAGRLSYVRVLSGSLADSEHFRNLRDGKEEKGGHLFRAQGHAREKLDRAIAGDLVAIPKMEHLRTGDTIAALSWEHGAYEGPALPASLAGLAVHPRKSTDAPKLLESLHKLEEEDPTFQVVKDADTHQLVVDGISQLHLQVALARMKARSKVEVASERRKVPYRETIAHAADDRYRHKKQSGGAGEFAEVALTVEPLERDEGFVYEWGVVGMSVSRTYMPSIEKGIRDVLAKGVIAGFPVVDVKAIVTDGKEHPVDSKDRAFQKAAREVFKLCVQKARPLLLEPIVKLEVSVPGESVGDITSDLAGSRRAHITNTEFHAGHATITATVPLAEVMEYEHQLKAMTAGEGTFSIEPSHYDVAPANVQQRVVADYEKTSAGEGDERRAAAA